jgi:hypothetical protein
MPKVQRLPDGLPCTTIRESKTCGFSEMDFLPSQIPQMSVNLTAHPSGATVAGCVSGHVLFLHPLTAFRHGILPKGG